MPHIDSNRRKPAAAVLVFVLASLALAACGSSSKSTPTATVGASATTPATGGALGAARGRFTAIRECLQKDGITLPKRAPGAPPAEGFLGRAPTLPKGVTKAQYEAALKKCGGFPRVGGFAGAGGGFNTPAARQALAKFAACMRENGVNVPTANTSGKGPIFNTKGLDTGSAKFAAADAKCRSVLFGAFRAHPGVGGPTGGPAATG